MTTPILAAEQITKAFNSATVLRGIDLHVAPGEKVAIMGPSGSGKSTFLNCLAGILTPTSGTVTFQGKVISSASDAQRSALRLRDFGFIFQDSMLIPELPARENVALPLRLTGVKTSDALDRADALLHHVGLGEHSHKITCGALRWAGTASRDSSWLGPPAERGLRRRTYRCTGSGLRAPGNATDYLDIVALRWRFGFGHS